MQKKKILMQFLIFFCYELIVCPLIFKSNKVYFASSLIAKPNEDHYCMTKASVIQQWDDSKNHALDFAIIKDTTLKSMNIRSSLSPGLAIFKKTSM